MTKRQYDELKLGDKVRNVDTNEIGIITVLSRGEVYVHYPSNPNCLVSYCIDEDDEPWVGIETI